MDKVEKRYRTYLHHPCLAIVESAGGEGYAYNYSFGLLTGVMANSQSPLQLGLEGNFFEFRR